jgi:hypothetical protein
MLHSLVLRTESVWTKHHQYMLPYSPKASHLTCVCNLNVKVQINFLIHLSNLNFSRNVWKKKVCPMSTKQATKNWWIFSFLLSTIEKCQVKILTNNLLGSWSLQILIQWMNLIKTGKIQLNWKCSLVFMVDKGHIFERVGKHWMKPMKIFFTKIIHNIIYLN